MTFYLQNAYPVVRRKPNATGNFLNVERCNLEDHWPGVELIPRQRRCAVVGNSGILNNSSCGDFIDSHDYVIRANMGLIKGYEEDVGRTTNLTAFNRALLFRYSNAILQNSSEPEQVAIRNQFLEHVQTLSPSILWYPKCLIHKCDKKSLPKYKLIIETIRKHGFSGIRFAFSWKPIHVER